MESSTTRGHSISSITYLFVDIFLSGSCRNDEAFGARLGDNIFLDYSAQNWGWHVEEVQQTTYGLALPFLRRGPLVVVPIQAAIVEEYDLVNIARAMEVKQMSFTLQLDMD